MNKKYSWKAIISLYLSLISVLGIAWTVFATLAGLYFAIFLGFVAMDEIKKKKYRGKFVAQLGVILSVAQLITIFVLMILYFFNIL